MRIVPGKAALPEVSRRIGWVMLLLSAGGCGTAQGVGGAPGMPPADAGRGGDALYRLDVRHPSVQQAIDPEGTRPQGYKFVQIEVAAVTNPQRHPLTFDVRYQSNDSAITFLGSFSLYPADHPGTFIVPTLGKVKNEGAILLSMVTPDKVSDQDPLSVAVRPMTFTNGAAPLGNSSEQRDRRRLFATDGVPETPAAEASPPGIAPIRS
jgi:hypothetical protein